VIDSVGSVTEENTATTEQMSANATQVSKSVETVAGIAEENSAATQQVSASAEEMSAQVEEIVASSQTLKDMALNLEKSVAIFKSKEQATVSG
jgi:methyl-accepting chemotaxis protein